MKNKATQKKICMVGLFGVGKTSLTRRFVYNLYDDSYLSSIGARVSQKLLPALEDSRGRLFQYNFLIWDIEGFEGDTPQFRNYLTGAAGALMVADVTRPESSQALPEMAAVLHSVAPQAPLVVAGNKSDLWSGAAVDETPFQAVAARLKAPLFMTSAKTGRQVEDCFAQLGRLIAG